MAVQPLRNIGQIEQPHVTDFDNGHSVIFGHGSRHPPRRARILRFRIGRGTIPKPMSSWTGRAPFVSSHRTPRWRRQSRANPSLKRGFSPEPSKTRFRWVLDVTNSERRRFASNSPEIEPPSLADGLTIAFYSRLYARVRARGQRRKTRYRGPRRAANSSRKRNCPAPCTN
jgi:hypothetical protein